MTCRPSNGRGMPDVAVFKDVTLTIRDGLIEDIGSEEPRNPDQVVDAEGGVVLPGFIDAHTHLVFAGTRAGELEWRAQGKSYQEIAELGGGILSTVRSTRAASVDELFEAGLQHLTWCLRNGTTTLEAKSGYGQDLESELHILLATHQVDSAFCESVGEPFGSRVFSTFLGLHALPPEHEDKQAFVDSMVDDVLPVVARAGLAQYVDAFVERGYFEHSHARQLAAKATELGLDVRLHVDQLSNGGGAALAADLGAVTADHLEQTGAEGIKALASSGTVPVLLPVSVLGLGLTKYPDARSMIDAGLPVVLATDFNPGSSQSPSIPLTMAVAVRTMKMTPQECLAAVTVNAARTLGLEDRGRLAPGLKADFSVWPFADWREVAYWMDGPRPSQVWVNGVKVN